LRDNEVITSHEDGSVRVWCYEDNELKEKKNFCYFNYPSTCSNSSIDDTNMISGSKDHSAIVWGYTDVDKILFSLVGHTDTITCADFVSDNLAATTSYDSSFRIWKLS